MKVKQAKLAQAIRGETSHILTNAKYDLEFDKGMLHVSLKVNPQGIGPFIVFPANIAYIEVEEAPVKVTDTAPVTSQGEEVTVRPSRGRPKKGE